MKLHQLKFYLNEQPVPEETGRPADSVAIARLPLVPDAQDARNVRRGVVAIQRNVSGRPMRDDQFPQLPRTLHAPADLRM